MRLVVEKTRSVTMRKCESFVQTLVAWQREAELLAKEIL